MTALLLLGGQRLFGSEEYTFYSKSFRQRQRNISMLILTDKDVDSG